MTYNDAPMAPTKECPFCGGYVMYIGIMDNGGYGMCSKCGVQTRTFYSDNVLTWKQKAADFWRRRK